MTVKAKSAVTKAGTSKKAAADRRKLFVDAYIANGRNATRAAITAGYSQNGARVRGAELLADRNIVAMVNERTEKAETNSGLTRDRVLQQIGCLLKADPRRLYHSDGSLKQVHELDDETAAAVSSIEFDDGGRARRIKLWDKNAALDKAMRHLGMYETDNAQRGESMGLQVIIVPAKASS